MISATLKGYWMYRSMLLWCIIKIIIFNSGFEKMVFFLTKFHFYIKHSAGISGMESLHFYQQESSLIGHQTNHRAYMFYLITNSRYELDCEYICIVINGKTGRFS